MKLNAIRDRFALDTARLAPYTLYSGVVGWSARRKLPRVLRRPLYTVFSRVVGANLAEAERPLAEYPTFEGFFSRRLRPGARVASREPGAVLSPADGVICAVGDTVDGQLVQAKGRAYSLAALVGDELLARRLSGGRFVTVYLSPRDYHRVHSPIAGRARRYLHIPGRLIPVNPLFVSSVDDLYVENERLVIELDTAIGVVTLVMVAAAGVGNLALCTPPVEFRGPRADRAAQPGWVDLDPPVEVAAGQELGAFMLGSTVIVLFEDKAIEWKEIAEGSVVRQGDAVAVATRGGVRRG